MNKLMKRARKNKKGFTLMEVIVVIAIVAILMAIAIPSVTGYIKEAEDQKYISVARAAYTDALLVEAGGLADGDRAVATTVGTYTADPDVGLGGPKDVFTFTGNGGDYEEDVTVNLFHAEGVKVTHP